MLRARDGSEFRIFLDADPDREIADEAQFSNLMNCSYYNNLLSVVTRNLKSLKLRSLSLLMLMAVKKRFGIPRNTERTEFLKENGFYFARIQVSCGSTRMLIENPSDKFPCIGTVEQVVRRNQYDLPPSLKGKTIIDAGANIGIFSVLCARLGAPKVYAFEPVKETFDYLVKNIGLNGVEDTVIPVHKALGDSARTQKIGFMKAGDTGASFLNQSRFENFETVDVVTLDRFLAENRLRFDFLKIDSEGYERQILQGAQESIRLNRPTLALSAYHNEDDKQILPDIVRKINPDYKIELLEYSEEIFSCTLPDAGKSKP